MKEDLLCEICGGFADGRTYRKIEGVVMVVCKDCRDFGEPIQKYRSAQPKRPQYKYNQSFQSPKNSIPLRKTNKIKKYQSKSGRDAPRVEELELLDDYRKIMKKKRQQLNLTLSEFANAIGITEASYRSIEAGKTDLLIKDALKVEKKYKVKLAEYAGFNEGDDSQEESKTPAGELTLGDMYLKKKKR